MIETQRLVDTACERAAADDFGPDTWQEGLAALARSLSVEGNLNELGTMCSATRSSAS